MSYQNLLWRFIAYSYPFSAICGKISLSIIHFFCLGIRSITLVSRRYIPAFIRLLIKFLGFSTNRQTFPSSATITTPKRLGSSTSANTIDPYPLCVLWKANNFSRGQSQIISLLKTKINPDGLLSVSKFQASFRGPAVPYGSGSLEKQILILYFSSNGFS